MYIEIDGNKIIAARSHYPYSENSIKIDVWPSINNEPARKKECFWSGSDVQLKTQEILFDEYKQNILNELKQKIKNEWLDVIRTVAEIKTQYDNFKSNIDSCTTIEQVDALYSQALTWLGLGE